MNVLSLFDGMSCGRIALERLGIKVDNYYASEIDKYAMKVSEANYPDIIQVGDVTKLDLSRLPKIDLVMGGSPCQGFSFAGKQLAFDDPRSALFFEFVRCVKELQPKYFLLENVRMKKEYLDIISEQMSVEPIMINSALVSAQNRVRYYWTNIPGIEQPDQRGIVLRDILETTPDNYTLMSDKFAKRQEGRKCLVDQNKEKAASLSAMEYVKNGRQGDYLACDDEGVPKDLSETHDTPKQIGTASDINGHDILKRVYSVDGKAPTLNAMGGGNREPKVMVDKRKPNQINPSKKANGVQPYMQDRVFHVDGKSHALTREFAARTNVGDVQEVYWRKLTPVECERLQTVPDNYTNHVSNTQRYKMLGNGWNVETVVGILKKIEDDI